MTASTIKFSALETNDIFEKDQKEHIIQKLNECFGQPSVFENKSGNTSISGHTNWILEKKHVWKVDDFEIFLKYIDDKQNEPDQRNFAQVFKSKIQQVYLVGLECNELPYFQLLIYVQLSLESEQSAITDSAKLIVPFQLYLQSLNGLSNQVYEMSRIKPRFHMHHVINSEDDLQEGTKSVRELLSLQYQNKKFRLRSTQHSKKLRELSLLQVFSLPTVLSAINFDGDVLSFITHYEQFGGGGELQTCGVTITHEYQISVCLPKFDSQGIEKEIKMFGPNLETFFSVTSAMNIHLFVTGIFTWLSYFEIVRNKLSEELESQRKQIQHMLNENNTSQITDFQNGISALQGNYASMGILLNSTKNKVIDQIDEMSSRRGIFGISEIPIPPKPDNFAGVLINRVGEQAYFELVANMIKNHFSAIAEKLDSTDKPINKMTDYIYNQTSLKLQKTVQTNSIIEILLAIVIGIFTFVSVKGFFGI